MKLPLILALLSIVWTATAVEFQPQNEVVELGTKFMFLCPSPIDSNASDLIWKENGVKLVTGNRYTIRANEPNGGILTLNRVSISDNGTIFSCSETSGSSVNILFSVRLIILAPDKNPDHRFKIPKLDWTKLDSQTELDKIGFPMIDSGASGSKVWYPYSGDEVRLPCYARGNPKPNIMWFKDTVRINRNDKRYSIATSNHLFIRNAQPEDSGIYACVAVNVHGTSASTPFEVHVLEQGKVSPEIFYTTLLCCIILVWVIFLASVFLLLRRAHSRRYARPLPLVNRPSRRVIDGPPPDYDSVVRMTEAVSYVACPRASANVYI